jgi:hypothetical protein
LRSPYAHNCTPIIICCQEVFSWYSIDMVRLITLLLLLAVPLTAYQAPPAGNEHEHTNKAGTDKSSANHEPENTPQTVIIQQTSNSEIAKKQGETQKTDAANPSHDWIDKTNAFSTLTIALFTIFLFGGLLWQVKTSWDIERPWIVVEPTDRHPVIGFIPEPGDSLGEPGRDRANWFAYSIKNTGNTPARILDSFAAYRMVDSLKNIPKEPVYPHALNLDEMLLVKDAQEPFLVYLEPNRVVTKAQVADLKARRTFWYAYGMVIYRDTFGRKHETRFGYIYFVSGDERPIGFVREGLPRKYYKAT